MAERFEDTSTQRVIGEWFEDTNTQRGYGWKALNGEPQNTAKFRQEKNKNTLQQRAKLVMLPQLKTNKN